jgi:fucose 4-O-acetylase-like acetyltransferase
MGNMTNMTELNIVPDSGKHNEEIDVFEMIFRIWSLFRNFFANIYHFVISVIIYLIQKSLWTVSFGIAGLLTGFLFFTFSDTVYVASFEADTGGVDNSVVINHINKLDMAVKKPDLLAKYLGLTVEEAQNIKSIKACYGIDVNGDG